MIKLRFSGINLNFSLLNLRLGRKVYLFLLSSHNLILFDYNCRSGDRLRVSLRQ